MTLDDEIREAAQAIVRAFRDNDEQAYFAGFVGSSRFVVNGPAGKVFTRRFSLRL